MDGGKTDNERELTSTMGNVLSVSIKDEKNDTSGSDATPTSSTDANTTTTSSQIVSDDPISSTSSDVVDLNKSKVLETATQSFVEISQTGMEEPDKASSVDPETDLLEMNISRERITEDVEDLVHDLESLLGESTDSFNIPIKRREEQKSVAPKEPVINSQKPVEGGDISSESPSLEKDIETVQNDDTEKKTTEDISDSSVPEEQTEEKTESSCTQESELCNTDTVDDNKVTNENVSSCGDKELPIQTSLESEIDLETKNVIKSPQEDQPDNVVNENEAVVESEGATDSKLENTESIATVEEDLTEEKKENIDNTDENVENDVVLNETEPEIEVHTEPVEEETVTKEEDTTNKPNDEFKGSEEKEVLNCTVETSEVEPSTIISDSSIEDNNFQKDECEKTEEADDAVDTVCQTGSISRDPKTEIVESVDSEYNEESSKHEEQDTQMIVPTESSVDTEPAQDDRNDNSKTENVVTADSPEEIKEEESPDLCGETDVVIESKLEDTVTVQSVIESKEKQLVDESKEDQDQVEVIEQSSEANVEEVNSPQIEAPVEVDRADDTELVTTVEDSEMVTENVENSEKEPKEKFELCIVEEPPSPEEVKSQIDIPESSETKADPDISVEITEIVEEVTESTKDLLPTQALEESNSNLIEPVPEVDAELEVPKSPTQDLPLITEEISNTIESTETDLISEANQEETPQDEPAIEEVQNDDVQIVPSEIESVTQQTTVIETIEITEDVSPTNDSSTEAAPFDVKEIEMESNTDNQQSSIEEKDDLVEPMDVLSEALNVEELVETEIEALTENIDEKCEEDKSQPEVLPEEISDVVEDVEEEIQKITEDLDQTCNQVSELMEEKCDEIQSEVQETPLDSETVDIPVISTSDIADEVESKNLDEPSLVAIDTPKEADTESEPNREATNPPDDICELSIETSDPELTNEVVKSTSVEEEISKTCDSQLEQDSINALEEVATEEDKEEQDFEWVEDVVSEEVEEQEPASSTEVVQDDETEQISKVIEILDDSKIIQVENVSFFSPTVDSDSEDTVPTLVLEPDEVNPSPEQSHAEKEMEQIDDPSLVVHSTNDTDIPDKLPEIEDILNDQGTVVDDVVENIDMQENLETILAVASLQSTENTDPVEALAEPQISDKERREMEALRKAVESITETAVEYENVEEVTELIENIDQQQSPTEVKTVDVSVEESDLKKEVHDRIEEIKTIPEEKPVQSSEVVNAEVSTNKIEFKDNKIDENHVKHHTSNAEEAVQTLPDTSEDKIGGSSNVQDTTNVLPDSSQSVSVNEENKLTETFKEKESKVKMNDRPKRHKKSSADNKYEELSINVDVPEREKPYSPKVTIKPIKVPDEEVSTTSNSDSEIGKGSLKMTITKQSDKMHSVLKICESDTSESIQEQDEPIPKLIIKPKMQQVEQQHSPKMSTRSSKQMYSPTSSSQRSGSPRITIKPVVKPEKVESVSPLKIKIKPEESSKKHSPKLNIKPVTKPEEECRENIQSPRKVTIKPVLKQAEDIEQVPSPRITIKPIPKPEPEKESISITPRLNIKPIKKQDEDDVEMERERSSPKITIKSFVKPQESDTQATEADDAVKERIVLKINKGNLPTPTKESKKREHPPDDEKSEKLAKITVKFSKSGGHAHIVQQPEESNKRAHEEQSPEKVKKLKLEIESPVLTRSKHKDVSTEQFTGDTKTKQREAELHIVETRSKHTHSMGEVPVEAKRAKLKETPEPSHSESRSKQRESINELLRSRANNENSDDVKIIETKLDSPIVISEDSRSQDSGSCVIVEDPKDPLGNVPVFEISMKPTPETPPAVPIKQDSASSTPATPTPRKRGRPRKVPIVVREEFKEQEEPPKLEPKKEEPQLLHESGRPKRSCRGQSARATLGIKPRKPRGPGRGRGSKRGMGTRVVPMKPEEVPKLSKAKLKLIQESLKVELLRTDEIIEREKKIFELPQVVDEDIKPPAPVLVQAEQVPAEVTCLPSTLLSDPPPQDLTASSALLPGASPKPTTSLLTTEIADSTGPPPTTPSTSRVESAEIVMVDEETRMSADTNSRAQTPAKQVTPADTIIEESQSSVQSTATTESGKVASSRPNKAPRLEVQEPEGAVISADQLTEYYWNGNGPFMLQEQVAQFLGIKSFKRKYPGIMRRMLEMQERDFIRESGLASEHMCDLGLTAVNSADILDIMYSDFQDKYEEYCKHQRDRQAKELINKQKALSLAASQEKNKADITEQAVQSAAQWNASFNKARKEQRKACMDLQTLTVHYPKGKMKQINKPKVGSYPVSLVPGQFTDYYKEFTPTEINNLPLNTMCYNEINIIPPEESEDSGSEGSDSDSDSSSSSSGSCSSSSGVEDCKLCKHTPKKGLSSK